jgi:hypothetical protein
MYVKCAHCGYDNSPEYRFCGMCGASLAHPPAAQSLAAKETTRSSSAGAGGNSENVHGPSFLGLAEDPKVEFHYLYEDEPSHSHVGLIFFLIIMLGAAGYLTYQWKNNGFPFNRLAAATSAGNNGGAPTSASPSEVAPASNPDQDTHIDKPMTGAGEVLPTQPEQSPQAQSKQAKSQLAESDIPAQGASSNQSQGANSTAANAAAQNTAAQNSAGTQPAPTQAQNAPEQTTQEPVKEAKSTPPPRVAEASRVTRETPRARTPKPTPSQAAAPAPGSQDADLEAAGERYLYGNGVPQNCARAEMSLRTAAMHGNTKAETVLGTMYATGHCVGRDLPTAYRWFARALHEDPTNSRISEDLQVLWRQMSPQEKQLATAMR